ncbi:hypothetical protein OAN77_00040 [bacterium]|nr:hypothetical protein [bacterium]
MSYRLLSFSNPKILKGRDVYSEYLSAILHLSPINTKICPYQDIAGCKEACLNTAGRGGIIKKGETTNTIQLARERKTKLFLEARDIFMDDLITDIQKFVRYCEKKGKLPCLRLNGTSDIQWETIPTKNTHYGISQMHLFQQHAKYFEGYGHPEWKPCKEIVDLGWREAKNIFELFPDVQFYDYTKIPTRKVEQYKNYHLTWSYSEANSKYAQYFDAIKYNIAVVFHGTMPIYYKGREVIDGDKSDIRFKDKPNVVVGLKAKGKARHDSSGFVIHTA